jgi:hypothetical protein
MPKKKRTKFRRFDVENKNREKKKRITRWWWWWWWNDDDDDDNDTAGRQKPVNERVGYLLAVEHDYFGGASAPPPPPVYSSQVTRDHRNYFRSWWPLSALTILTVCKERERERELRAFITNRLAPGWLAVGGGGGSMEMSSSLVSVSRQKVINLINNQTQRGHSKQAPARPVCLYTTSRCCSCWVLTFRRETVQIITNIWTNAGSRLFSTD